MNGAADELVSRFVQFVGEWLKAEFCESLLINNELKVRSKSDIDDRLRAIESYVNFKPEAQPMHGFHNKVILSFNKTDFSN